MNQQLPAHQQEHRSVISGHTRTGLTLLCLYFAMYLGFVLLNVFAPRIMSGNEIPVGNERYIALGGANLAVAYALALLLVGVFLSLVYMRAPRSPR